MSSSLSSVRVSQPLFKCCVIPECCGRQRLYITDTNRVALKVQLEYRDEFGRIQNPYQAYRQLSHSFRDEKPEKEKKRIKAYEFEMNKMLSGEGSIAAMNTLQRRQRQSRQAQVIYPDIFQVEV